MKKLLLVFVLMLSGCSYISPLTKNSYNYEKIEKLELLNEFSQIEADTEFSDLVIKTGKTFEIKTEFYGAKWKPEFKVEEGTLYVSVIDTMPNANNWNSNKTNTIEITYPEKQQFTDVTIKSEFGDLYTADLNTDKMKLDLSYGDFEIKDSAWNDYAINISFSDGMLQNSTLNRGTLSMEYGTLDADTLQSEKLECLSSFTTFTSKNTQLKEFIFTGDYSDLRMKEATGDLFTYTNEFGSLSYHGQILKECKADSSYGEAKFILQQAESEFDFDLHIDMGNIHMNGIEYEKSTKFGSGSIPFDGFAEFGDIILETK